MTGDDLGITDRGSDLHLDAELGSIEIGKRADFAVLDDDPTAVDAMALKDIPVWGTVQGGRIFPAAEL